MGLATAGSEAELFTVDEGKFKPEEALSGYFSYPLVLQCILLEEQIELIFDLAAEPSYDVNIDPAHRYQPGEEFFDLETYPRLAA